MSPAPIRFSVIIPAYNAAATIAGAVDSVLAQSDPVYEVIVVNDCSTDDTEALLTRFGNRIICISNRGNKGPSGARNTGIRQATGDFIAFLDADDVWHPDKLRLMAGILSQRPEIGFLFHAYTLGNFPEHLLVRQPVKFSFVRLLLRNPVATPCAVIRRHPELHFDESMHYLEDYDLFLREAWRTPAYYLALPLTRLGRPVLSAGGQSSNRWAMRKGEWKAYAHLGRLNPLFYLLLPFLICWSLAKHGFKPLREGASGDALPSHPSRGTGAND